MQIRHALVSPLNRLQPQLTILCIDDDPAILKLYELRLSVGGTRVLTSADGHHGFAAAIESNPDVILLDNDLAGEKGVDLLGRLRSHPATANIHVVMVTGSNTPALQRGALMHGVVDVLQKPVDCGLLIDTLNRLAAARRSD
jgi:CheY-like chemotaxis protein